MTVVDAHVHVYPEKIALRAAESVGDFYQYPMFKEGSIPAMLAAVEGSPITHHIIYSVATKPSNVESINDFIAAECKKHPNFVGFMAMHQDYPNPEAEIERAIGLGLRGMKLHPDTQKVNMDDDRLMRIYELIEGRMPLVMHCGDYRTDFSHPRRMIASCTSSQTSSLTRRTSAAGRCSTWLSSIWKTKTASSTCRARRSFWGVAARGSFAKSTVPTESCSGRTSPCGTPQKSSNYSSRSTSLRPILRR